MPWSERWHMLDPAIVYERREAHAAKQAAKLIKGAARMNSEVSDEIEALLEDWYHYEASQREFLGHSRVSPMFRDARAEKGNVHSDADETDARIRKFTCEMVSFCVDQLHYLLRAAIQVHFRNKDAGNSVHRNPRLGTIEAHHAKYQEAKELLCPILVRKGLVKR